MPNPAGDTHTENIRSLHEVYTTMATIPLRTASRFRAAWTHPLLPHVLNIPNRITAKPLRTNNNFTISSIYDARQKLLPTPQIFYTHWRAVAVGSDSLDKIARAETAGESMKAVYALNPREDQAQHNREQTVSQVPRPSS